MLSFRQFSDADGSEDWPIGKTTLAEGEKSKGTNKDLETGGMRVVAK